MIDLNEEDLYRLDAFYKREYTGCSDGNCIFRKERGGQHTNGGCHCLSGRVNLYSGRIIVAYPQLRREISRLTARNALLEKVAEAAASVSCEGVLRGDLRCYVMGIELMAALAALDAK